MEITYSHVGDYLLPDIRLNEPPPKLVKPLGRYGLLRQKYLQSHRTIMNSQHFFGQYFVEQRGH